MPKRILGFCLLLFFSEACEQGGSSELVVAQVGDRFYTQTELNASIPDDLSVEDSTELATNLIHNWLMGELMFEKAALNLKEEQLDIELQVENYRKDLFIFAYEKELVNQKLDTSISEDAIRAFYIENSDMFQLNDYILKVKYVKLRPGPPDLDNVKDWMRSEEAEAKEKLMDYCQTYAVRCFTDTQWVYFNELLRELPIEVYNKEGFLRSGNLVDFRDGDHLYLLLIKDIQSKSTLSPLELERKRIQNLILNKRKIELLNTIRRRIYRDAVSNGNAKTYDAPQIP